MSPGTSPVWTNRRSLLDVTEEKEKRRNAVSKVRKNTKFKSKMTQRVAIMNALRHPPPADKGVAPVRLVA